MPEFAFLDANVQTTGSLSTTGLPGATAASRYVGATVSGPPVTGTWLVGDFIIDRSGSFWVCAIAGTPGGWFEAGNNSTVVQLTDAPVITVDVSLGNDFRVLLNGSRALGNPVNMVDGSRIILQITQGASGGPFTLSFGTAYAFGTTLPSPTLSTAAGKTDLLGFVFNAAKSRWLFTAFAAGFS